MINITEKNFEENILQYKESEYKKKKQKFIKDKSPIFVHKINKKNIYAVDTPAMQDTFLKTPDIIRKNFDIINKITDRNQWENIQKEYYLLFD